MSSLIYTVSKNTGFVVAKLYFRMKTIDIENVPLKGPVLLVTNHQSYMDPLFLGSAIKRSCHYMARETLFDGKFLGPYMSRLNSFPVKRDSGDVKAIKEIISRLNQGFMVNIFPEGTRTSTGKISQFKSGIELITRRSQATIVPVLIEGAYEAWPKGQLLPWPKKVYVQYCPPISHEEIQAMEKKQLAATLTDTLRQAQSNLRKRIGRKPFDYN